MIGGEADCVISGSKKQVSDRDLLALFDCGILGVTRVHNAFKGIFICSR